MQMLQFHIQRFRNLMDVHLVPQSLWIGLWGQNGQGKTNVLEALYLSVTGKSFRQAFNRDMIGIGHDNATCWLQFQRQHVQHELALVLQPNKKLITLDGKQLHHRSDLLQAINVVGFFPDDLQLIKGSPELRRKFLDKVVGVLFPQGIDVWKRYTTLLAQRNALLRQQQLQGVLQVTLDEQLATAGSQLRRLRQQGLQQLAPFVQQAMLQFDHGPIEMTLSYERVAGDLGLPGDDPTHLHQQLQQNLRTDRLRKITTQGPHRDDVVWLFQGHSARHFCSQGQQRALVLACKLAEVTLYARHLGQPPLLLLDDVSSELDGARLAKFFAAVHQEGCQVWLTATGIDDRIHRLPCQWYQMQNGALSPRSLASLSA